jgi:hypothetical protein
VHQVVTYSSNGSLQPLYPRDVLYRNVCVGTCQVDCDLTCTCLHACFVLYNRCHATMMLYSRASKSRDGMVLELGQQNAGMDGHARCWAVALS